MKEQSTLILDLNVGQTLKIGNNVTVTLVKKTGQLARLAIKADRSVPIDRVNQERK
jgi:sRNA-binding carbon storage regulator CsrA